MKTIKRISGVLHVVGVVLLCFALILGLRLLAIFFHIGMPRFLYYDDGAASGPAQ